MTRSASSATRMPPAMIWPPPAAMVEPEAGVDDLAEPAAVDERRQRRRRDHLHRRGPEAGGQVRHRQRQLHPPQHLPAGHAHAPRRVARPPDRPPGRPGTRWPAAAARAKMASAATADRRRNRRSGDEMASSANVGTARVRLATATTDAAAPAGVAEPDARAARPPRSAISTAARRDLQVLAQLGPGCRPGWSSSAGR